MTHPSKTMHDWENEGGTRESQRAPAMAMTEETATALSEAILADLDASVVTVAAPTSERRRTIAALGADACRMFAVASRPIAARVLMSCTGLDERRATSALRALCAVGLLRMVAVEA